MREPECTEVTAALRALVPLFKSELDRRADIFFELGEFADRLEAMSPTPIEEPAK
jgi:hypothetical protein